jgi:hypothetical protein
LKQTLDQLVQQDPKVPQDQQVQLQQFQDQPGRRVFLVTTEQQDQPDHKVPLV